MHDNRKVHCGEFPENSEVTTTKSEVKYTNLGVIAERSPSLNKNPYEACFWHIRNPIVPNTVADRAYVEFLFPLIEDTNVFIYKGNRLKPEFLIEGNGSIVAGAPIRIPMG